MSDCSYSRSFLGAASIIFSALYKRRVLSPRVHPIFVFSIADIMLSMLWIAGSALWLLRHSSMRRGWCFAASLMTVVSAHSPQINDKCITIAYSAKLYPLMVPQWEARDLAIREIQTHEHKYTASIQIAKQSMSNSPDFAHQDFLL